MSTNQLLSVNLANAIFDNIFLYSSTKIWTEFIRVEDARAARGSKQRTNRRAKNPSPISLLTKNTL